MYHQLSKHAPEIRAMIWQQASLHLGRRIVELKPCMVDHGPQRCYVADHKGINYERLNCCFHLPGDLGNLGCNGCRCSPSVIRSAKPGEMAGHTAETGQWHLHGACNTRLQPLLSVSKEVSYEAQRFRKITYYSPAREPSLDDRGNLVPARPELSVTTYFDYRRDILAIHFNALESITPKDRFKLDKEHSIQGLDRVKSLILRSPGIGRSIDTCELVEVLKLFPELQALHITLGGSEIPDIDQYCDQTFCSILNSPKKFHLAERKNFSLMRDQIDWLRENSGGKRIPCIDLVMIKPVLRDPNMDDFPSASEQPESSNIDDAERNPDDDQPQLKSPEGSKYIDDDIEEDTGNTPSNTGEPELSNTDDAERNSDYNQLELESPEPYHTDDEEEEEGIPDPVTPDLESPEGSNMNDAEQNSDSSRPELQSPVMRNANYAEDTAVYGHCWLTPTIDKSRMSRFIINTKEREYDLELKWVVWEKARHWLGRS